MQCLVLTVEFYVALLGPPTHTQVATNNFLILDFSYSFPRAQIDLGSKLFSID